MDLREGFQIDEPDVFVPWSVSQAGLRQLLDPRLREVTRGYFTIPCTSLGGLRHGLGFHFDRQRSDHLSELEFYALSARPIDETYAEFQRHFEGAFGPATRTRPGTEGFALHEWIFPTARIVHLVQERFGPEEHMRIQRLAPLAPRTDA
jgi:hypothetical protein